MKLSLFVVVCSLALGAVSALSDKKERAVAFAIADLGPGYSLKKVKSVETQVVRGITYHIKAKVRYQIPGGIERMYVCSFEVWERPYGRKTVEESSCN